MTASLSASGSVPRARAIAGSEVAITVESMFSMNSATATMSGTMRSAAMGCGACTGFNPSARSGSGAIAEIVAAEYMCVNNMVRAGAL